MGLMGDIPEQDKKGLRSFGLITGAIIAVLFGLFFPLVLLDRPVPTWPWVIAGVLWLWALALPNTLRPVYHGWMHVGHVLGWVNTRIILGVVFYVVVLPMGLVMRIFADPMARRRTPAQTSYRVESVRLPKERMERPY